ncbi:beta-N-acetylhexosaminidase family protein [Goodfellowiella coeruleoviolacea]|uniref:Hyaluronoglucosaminidase n=1 Tax=Goodfellowiella coeruleoviolacea TaxID=334858 RepID=A0AAE3KJW2_9PSEU|nr:beta-N-acetylglucosaminidase domain-containing protein [Goodfellowiella coeruleoviolacea]MCP2164768.1 hyaluronoglucosaminidase [Goodfellowiella coeruleoviolacea]
MRRKTRPRWSTAVCSVLASATAVLGVALPATASPASTDPVSADSASADPVSTDPVSTDSGSADTTIAAGLPVVTPTPQRMTANGAPVTVRGRVQVLVGTGVDQPTRDLVRQSLTAAGASEVRFTDLADSTELGGPAGPNAGGAGLTVVVGTTDQAAVAQALRAAGGSAVDAGRAEGYALASRQSAGRGLAVLAGVDADGVYYAAQTLRQLVGDHRIAAVSIVDYPLMALRGTIEGFYGAPWSHAARLDQLATYGRLKMNTYVYTPKDDTYLRDRWRDAYPADQLDQLAELVRTARDNHVRFTFALAPGLSICYTDPDDLKALTDKLESVYAIGVRSFYISLDDISYTTWNCESDRQRYGAASAGAAGQAQTDLLNTVQHDFLDTHADTRPLQMVPTEYSDLKDSPYKTALRTGLDPRIVVQWTGTDVVPPSITVEQASQAHAVWGRKVFVWDNYPVNDYGQTTGRLLLAPYDKREPGLHDELTGLVINPMNQASASKVAEFGAASFAWNDQDYDAQRTWRAAAEHLAGGDARTTQALLAFFDTQHLAPTFGPDAWQPQAPVLAARLDAFRTAWASGDPRARTRALADLAGYAHLLASAGDRIRGHVNDQLFLAEAAPWLDALDLWGQAFEHTVAGLGLRLAGADRLARQEFDTSAGLAARAAAIRTIPGTTRPQGPIKVADGVLDTFLAQAPGL